MDTSHTLDRTMPPNQIRVMAIAVTTSSAGKRVHCGWRLLVAALALPLLAAGPQPQRGISLNVPANRASPLPVPPTPPPASAPPNGFEPAPLPNRDVESPAGPRASGATTVAPSLFNRSDTYRGEGFSKGSTPQTDQDRRVRPGAGFSLKMPLSPN